MHTSSPETLALPDGGEIMELDSSEQKPLEDFDATNNRACQTSVLVFNSEMENTREASKRWCMTESALSLVDSTTRISSTDFNAPNYRADLVRAYQRDPFTFNSEKKDTTEGLSGECLSKSVLSDDDSTKRNFFPDCTTLASFSEMTIEDFDDGVGMLPDLKDEFIDGLFSSCGNERIIVCTTNHRERDDAALPPLVNMDTYIHMASAQPVALPDGGEIVKLDSSEQKPLEDFDATSNRSYQSNVLVSNSEGKSRREASRRQCMPESASRRQCMPESVLSLVDSTTRISLPDFDAPNSSAYLVRAYQSGPIVFNLEKKDLGEGINKECLTKSVFSLDDSSRQKSLPDVDATKNKARLVRAYQKGLVVSLSENKNRGDTFKRECITKSILGLEDLQQHSGGRRDADAKNFGAIHDPGIHDHTTDFLARKSFRVVETLPTREQPNDCVPLLSIGRLTLEGWVQEEKSPNLPRVLQINVVEQRVTKLPICFEGLTAESASSSPWPISLPDGRHVVVLDPLDQSSKNVAHAARVDQCSPTVSLSEKKMVRKTLERKCRTMRVIFEIHQQYFGRRCEGSAKSFRVMRICRKRGINPASRVKRIHKQHGIHQWPFHQKWATRKGYSSGDEKPFEVSSLSMDEKLDSGLLFIQMSKFTRSSPWTLALPDRGEIVEPIASSSSEFVGTNDRPHLVRQDQSSSTASDYERKNTRETSDREGITMSSCSAEDLQQYFGCKHKDDMKRLDVSISMFKSTCRQHQGYWWPCRIENNEARIIDTFSSSEKEAFDATNNKAHLVKADQSSKTKSFLSLEDLQHQYGGRRKNAGKGLRNSLARKPFEEHQESQSHKLNSLSRKSFKVLHVLPLWEQSNNIRHLVQRRRLVLKRWVRLNKSQDLPRTLQIMNCPGSLTAQSASSLHWPISLPDGACIVSLLEKKTMRKTFKRKYSAMGASFEDHQQHFSSRCECSANSLGAKRICEQHRFNLVSTVKRIRRQYGIHRCTFQQGYSFQGERPAGVVSPSMEEKLVSRLEFVHISWLARFSRHPLDLRSGSEISGHIVFSSSELAATNNRAHPRRQDRRGSSAPRPDKERTKETKKGEGTYCRIISLEVLEQHVGKKREDVAKILGISVSTFKRVCREHGIPRWQNRRSNSVWRPPDQLEGQTTQSIAHPNPIALVSPQPQTSSTHMLSENEDSRHLLASRAEADLNGHVSASSNLVFRACSDAAASSQAASRVLQKMPMTTQVIPQMGGFFETFQLEGQLTQSTSHPNPEALIFPQPQTTSPHMLSENMWSVEACRRFLGLDAEPLEGQVSESAMLKVKCGDKTIRFELPFMSGKSELKKEVEKRLELELDSFNVEYEDEEGDWIFLGRDEDFRNHLQHFFNQVIKLRVHDEVSYTTNFCRRCRSLKRKRR